MFGMMALWLLVPAGLVWWMLDQGRTRPMTGGSAPDALQILEQRFARGEIDAAEFETRRSTIQAAAMR